MIHKSIDDEIFLIHKYRHKMDSEIIRQKNYQFKLLLIISDYFKNLPKNI